MHLNAKQVYNTLGKRLHTGNDFNILFIGIAKNPNKWKRFHINFI